MKNLWKLLSVAVYAATGLSMAAATAPTDSLPALRQQFEQALNEAGAAYVQQTADKPKDYVKAIESLEAERRQTGDLDAVVALRQERTHFLATTNVVVGTARDEQRDVRILKSQYLRQLTRFAEQRDQAIVAAAQTYTNQLALMKVQLTRAGKAREALLVQDEVASVGRDARVQAATLARYTNPETPGGAPATNAVPPLAVADPLNPAHLLEESVVSFKFADADLDTPADLLSRLAQRCQSRGVRLRATAPRLNVKSVQTEGSGAPRFVLGPRQGPGRSRGRAKTYTFDAVPLRTVLQAFCAGAGLGYTVDADNREIVLVDADDPKATWAADPQPPNEILKDLQSSESRRQHIGRALLFTGEVTGTVQGMNELVLTLKDGTKLGLPSTAANRVRFERIRNAMGTAEKRDKSGVEATALATIRADSSAQGLVLGDAVLLEVNGVGNTDLTVPAGTGTGAQPTKPGRAIRRIGEQP